MDDSGESGAGGEPGRQSTALNSSEKSNEKESGLHNESMLDEEVEMDLDHQMESFDEEQFLKGIEEEEKDRKAREEAEKKAKDSSEVRKSEKEKAVNSAVGELKQQTRFSTNQALKLMEPIILKTENFMRELDIADLDVINWHFESAKQRKIVDVLQEKLRIAKKLIFASDKLVGDQTNFNEPSSSSATHPTTVATGQVNGMSTQELVSFLTSRNIDSINILEEILNKNDELEEQVERQEFSLQTLKRDVDYFRCQLSQANQKSAALEMKLSSVEDAKEKVEKRLRDLEMDLRSNSITRRGLKGNNVQFAHETHIQIPERISPPNLSSTPKRDELLYGEFPERKNRETARRYNASTEEMLSTVRDDYMQADTYSRTMSHNNRNNDSYTYKRNYEPSGIEKSLPDPPKFSADKNSINVETFEKMFNMKYGGYNDEHQVILLETKFLTGTALRAFKGIRDSDKTTVTKVLLAIRSRLQISETDEYRRGIQKFHALKLQKNQSMEDFCLTLDELAREAYKRLTPAQFSTEKTTKLLAEIKESQSFGVLHHLLLTEISKWSEEDHYDVCREQATRFDQNCRGSYQKVENGDKKGNRQNSPNRVGQRNAQYQQNSWSPSQNTASRQRSDFNQTFQNGMQNQSKPYQYQNPQYQYQNPSSAGQGQFDRTQYNWRDRKYDNGDNRGSSTCFECKEIGCHKPECSKAPRAPRDKSSVVCYTCGGKGHYSNECKNSRSNAATEKEETPVAAIDDKECLEIPMGTASEEQFGPANVRIEKGRIGNAEVELMLDSGACISVMSHKTWKEIVRINGSDWESKSIVENAKMIDVSAANNQPVKLLFQVIVETAMQSRTREITFHVADIDRDNIILGIDQFKKLGVQMSIEETPREIRIVKDIKLKPGCRKVVEVVVEGVVVKDKNHCLLSPKNSCLAPAICKVDSAGKTVVQLANYSREPMLLRAGEVIAVGELEGFEVIQEKSESLKELEDALFKEVLSKAQERCDGLKGNSDGKNVCTVSQTKSSEERWITVSKHLNKNENVSREEEEVWKVIKEFQHIFATDDSELGRTHAVQCEIELTEGAEPVRQKPRPIPLAIRPEIRKMLQKMLAQGVIRESRSPWASPVVLVKKKDGSVRMCIDYRKVNKMVRYNAHPLPNIESTLQSLAGKVVFTTLDLLAGFWQIPLTEGSKQITAFAIGSELFEWEVLPFGLVISPAIFQATMEAVVGDLLGQCAFVYIDDLLIASESIEQHVKDVRMIMERIERSGMKFRASKCHIACAEVDYLGHKVTPKGVKTEESKVEKMKSFTRPTNAKELHSFLGLVVYYRKFILNFAQMAASLTPLTAPKSVWLWGEDQETSFQKLIQAVCSTPVLMQPDPERAVDGTRPFLLYTDASRKGVGAVLAQEGEDGEQHPIAFASKSLTKAETNYHITDLEALAMMFALRRFKAIIYGTQVVVFTDHKPLMYLLKGSPLADRLLRWSIEILEFNVRIVYVKGKLNAVADALSRGGCAMLKEDDIETGEMPNIISEIKESSDLTTSIETFEWFKMLQEEEGWKEVIDKLEQNEISGKVKIPGIKSEVSLEDYMLIGKSLRNTENENCNRLVVPAAAVSQIIREAHEGYLAGHFGTEKMLRQLSKRFFWPRMRASIESFVKACQQCLCTNDHQKLVAPLTPYITEYPLEIVACDLIDVGLSTQGNRYILTIIDLFTKFGTAVPIPDKKAETVLRAFIERWAIGEGRIPDTLLTDQGKEFVNEHFQKFTTLLNINHICTKGYNSRANGAIERYNKTLMHIIKKKNAVPLEWDDQVPFAVFAYNNIAHSTTGETPMFLMSGRDSRTGLEKSGDVAGRSKYINMDEYKNILVTEMHNAYEVVREHAKREQDKYKHLFDVKYKTDQRNYPQPGSRVLVEIPAEKLGAKCPKLVNKWQGPYRVISCSENSAKVIPVDGNKKEMMIIPFDNLRIIPIEMDNTPITTKKNRARGVLTGRNNEINGIDAMCNMIEFFSNIFHCRCEKTCIFSMDGDKLIRSASPTHFVRLWRLREEYPNMNAGELMVLSQKPLPDKINYITDQCWNILCRCPTFSIWVKEVRGWEHQFESRYAKAMETVFGKELFAEEKIAEQPPLIFLLPRVLQSCLWNTSVDCVTISDAHSITPELKKEIGEATSKTALLVAAFNTDYQEQEVWQNVIDMIPQHIAVIVVPAPAREYNYGDIPKFTSHMTSLIRAKGQLFILSPAEPVMDARNIPLVDYGERNEQMEYWKTVERILVSKTQQDSWPEYLFAWDPTGSKVVVTDSKSSSMKEVKRRTLLPNALVDAGSGVDTVEGPSTSGGPKLRARSRDSSRRSQHHAHPYPRNVPMTRQNPHYQGHSGYIVKYPYHGYQK